MACRSARGGATQGQTSGEFCLATYRADARTTVSGESPDERRRGMGVKIADWRHAGQTRCKINRARLGVLKPARGSVVNDTPMDDAGRPYGVTRRQGLGRYRGWLEAMRI